MIRKLTSLFRSSDDGKFGTMQGVLIPNVLMMIGVILFMRLGWVLGHVGIFGMVTIISISAILLLSTGLSLTAIVSNMKMRAGGAYYLISRTLGIEFGSAIGLLIFTSQLCSISLCVTGFSLSLHELLPDTPLLLIKAATLGVLTFLAYFSTNLALKAQFFIFITLAASIVAIFFGSDAPPASLLPTEDAQQTIGFWVAFSMFFPAMTGIECGMSMSGDLRNPSKALPIGTLGAIGIIFSLYLTAALFLSSNVSTDLLKSHPLILYHMSKAGYLIIMGIWAATLSSALGAILGAPRIMQAVAKDGILPKLLAQGHGSTNQPRIATLVVVVLGMALTLGTDINQIIPMMSMACLVSYGLINFIAFFETFIKNPSWRPAFRIPSMIPLAGAIGCFMAMFMINPGAAFIMLFLVSLLCFWTAKRKVQGNWDDLRHAIFSYFVHKGTVKLSNLDKSAKSWRPHILAIFDTTSVNKNLAFFSHAINQEKGFLTFAACTDSEEVAESAFKNLKEDLQGYNIPSHIHVNLFRSFDRQLGESNITQLQSEPDETLSDGQSTATLALPATSVCPSMAIGAEQIIQNYGFGLLRPNTVIFSIPNHFEVESFVQLLLDTHAQEKNIVLLKDDPQKDYLYSDPLRKDKQINLWWRGKYPGNFELCLALAYLLQQSKLWPRSKMCIQMIVRDEKQRKKLLDQFDKYRTKLRIENLSFDPLVDAESLFFPNFHAYSGDADLTFLGLKKPTETTTVEEYKEYYLRLLENTSDLNNVAYVLCGERVKFRKIFI